MFLFFFLRWLRTNALRMLLRLIKKTQKLSIPVWAYFADMPASFVWQLIQPLMAKWYSFFLSCSASAHEHHRTCALTEHLLNCCSYQQSFPRLCNLFHAMQTLLQNVCFPHGFFCGLSLDVIQELKGQHYLCVADKEMRHLKTHSEFREIQFLSSGLEIVLGLVFQTWCGIPIYPFLIFTLRDLFLFRLLPSLS